MFRLHVGVPVMAVLLLAGGWLLAEDPKKADEGGTPAKVRTPPLPAGWKQLKLDKEQKAKVAAIQIDYAKKIAALQKQIEELRKEEKAEMTAVLTDEQKKQLQAFLLGEPKSKDKDDKTPSKKESK
jgi:cell division protein ZapA (FtsZ GTPase activity inhibitor)